MKRRPSGDLAEQKLTEMVSRWGKLGFVYRIEDASDLYGLNKTIVNSTRKPSDHVVVLQGKSFWCECKETQNPDGFPVKNIAPHQMAYARQIEAAGGNYSFFIYSLTHKVAYLVPARELAAAQGVVPWRRLAPWAWKEGDGCPKAIAA